MARIFCVEDCQDTRKLLQATLGRDHDLVFFDGLKSIGQWFFGSSPTSLSPNLVLMDIGLPDGSGLEFMAETGQRLISSGIDVIFLTGTNTTVSRIRGFTLGATDYISKPFDPMELMVRVNSKLRSHRSPAEPVAQLRTPRLEIDLSRQSVTDVTSPERKSVKLTPVEFRLLVLLVRQYIESPQLPVSREFIAKQIFGDPEMSETDIAKVIHSRSIDHHVSTLRKKINQIEHQIESIYGIGYRLICA